MLNKKGKMRAEFVSSSKCFKFDAIPPLRERVEDIEHHEIFIRQISEKLYFSTAL